MAKQVWNWNNFRGGLSDNPYLGQEGQFQDGINVDVQTEPNGFKLTAPIAQQISSVSTRASVIIDTSDYGLVGDYADLYTFTQYDGATQSKVYKGTSATAYYSDATGSAIIGATAMWVSGTLAMYYFTQNGTIHKLTLSGSPTHSTLAGSFTSGQDKIVLTHYGDDVYFCAGNVFYKLDSVTETFAAIFTAGKENTFTGITFFQDSFHLYSKASGGATGASTPRHGRQFIIRLGQTSPDYIVKWDRLPILGACNVGATDYVITGFGPRYSDLYAVSGTQRQLIRSNYEGQNLARQFTGEIISWKDEVFLLGRNKDSQQSQYASSIFRLGKYFPGMPQALTEIYRASTTTYITTLFASLSELYLGYDRSSLGGAFSVQKINLDTPCTTYTVEGGYIVSNIFSGAGAELRKTIDEINISYMCDNTNPYFPHGGTIKIYARKNPIDSWTQISSSYTKTDIGNIRITAPEVKAANMGDFYQIELKCELIRGSTTLSPLVTGVKILYDDNLQA